MPGKEGCISPTLPRSETNWLCYTWPLVVPLLQCNQNKYSHWSNRERCLVGGHSMVIILKITWIACDAAWLPVLIKLFNGYNLKLRKQNPKRQRGCLMIIMCVTAPIWKQNSTLILSLVQRYCKNPWKYFTLSIVNLWTPLSFCRKSLWVQVPAADNQSEPSIIMSQILTVIYLTGLTF